MSLYSIKEGFGLIYASVNNTTWKKKVSAILNKRIFYLFLYHKVSQQ